MAVRKTIYSYKLHSSMKDTACFYCGCYGEAKDHVPPVSYPDHYEESERILVRSCLLCNSLLGNRYYLTILSRCEYLLYIYRRRYKKLLEMPVWRIEEVEELSGRLKRTIIQALKKKKYIEGKIVFIENNINILQGY